MAVITDATGVGNLGNGVVGLLQRHAGLASDLFHEAGLRTRTPITYRLSISSSGRLWPFRNRESQIPRLRPGQAPNSYASGFAQSITTKSNPNLKG